MRILKARSIKIYLDLALNAYNQWWDVESIDKYILKKEVLTKAWDFSTGKMVEKNLGPGKEWIRFTLKS